MIRNRGTMRSDRGFALVAVLMISVVLVLLALGAAVTGSIDRAISGNQLRGNAAYYAADAGMAHLKTTLFRNLVDYYRTHPSGWCAPPVEGGIDFGSFILQPGIPSPLIAFGTGGGGYRLWFDLVGSNLILTSVGQVGSGRATIRMVASAGGGPSTAWDNAIFAKGQSPDAQAINGNVSVYGSVHIVNGEMTIDEMDPAYTTTGDAGVFNDYVGAGTGDSYILDKLSSITPTTESSGEPIDLCARVKVAKGSVYLQSGSSVIGAYGHPVYTVNLGAGFVYRGKPGTGAVAQISDWHDSNGLVTLKYPETAGINSGYGAYNDVVFPELADSFPDDGGFTARKSTCGWLFGENADGTVFAQLPPPDASTPHTCGDGTNAVEWVTDTANAAGGHLVLRGTVNIPDNDLEIHETTTTLTNGTTWTDGVHYSGMGVLRVGASDSDTGATVKMTGSLKPLHWAGFPGSYAADGTFVPGDALAVITPGTLTVDLPAADQVTAFLGYAGSTFAASKQVVLVGAIVAGAFDLGKNVPKIAYAKGVGDAAEVLGLPGTFAASGVTAPNQGVLSDISIERTELPDWAVGP